MCEAQQLLKKTNFHQRTKKKSKCVSTSACCWKPPSCVLNFRSVIWLVWCCSSLTSSFCLTRLLCVLWLLRHHHSFKPRVRAGLLLILCRLWWHLAVVVPAVAEKMKKKGRHQCLKKKKKKENQATGCVQRLFLTNLYWRKIWMKNFCLSDEPFPTLFE